MGWLDRQAMRVLAREMIDEETVLGLVPCRLRVPRPDAPPGTACGQ